MAKILVSLISDQTIPNVEFIREMKDAVDSYLFVSTNGMERNGNRQWILNTVNLHENKILEPVIVDAFSFEDIEEKLMQAVNDEDTYFVNLTGGTKVMSLAVYEFFKTVNSEMYYLTGQGKKIKVHPGRKKVTSPLKSEISLSDYLTAHGFKIEKKSEPLKSKETADILLKYFLNEFNKERDIPMLEILRGGRNKGVKNLEEQEALREFLASIGFEPQVNNQLTKYECQYLSGEWLEEYLFHFIKVEFKIQESAIAMGLVARKNDNPNEFDVLLMKNNKIYLFECKTSIYIDSDESQTFIGETIYKSDSLRNKFGLFAQTTVVTLSDLTNPKLVLHLKRAEASKVKLIGRDTFVNQSLFEELKKI